MSARPQSDDAPPVRILVVEHNADLRGASTDLLAALGHAVLPTASIADAAELVSRGAFDLAIVNAYPDRGSGVETVERLRAGAPELPILMVSGYGDDADLRRRVDAGELSLLPLPFTAETLAGGVRAALAARRRPAAPPGQVVELPARAAVAGGTRRGVRPWLAAAAVVAAVGVASLVELQRPPALPPPAAESVARGALLRLHAPLGAVELSALGFDWEPVAGAAVYRLEVYDVAGAKVWAAAAGATRSSLPAGQALRPATTYRWRVTAFDAAERPLAFSQMTSFQILPEPSTDAPPALEEE